jgi:hypothetical protein
MRQRTFFWAFVSFLLGMGVAYGLVALDRHARIPRLARTDIFEVVARDGTVLRLTYAEIEREREEFRQLLERHRERPRAKTKPTTPGRPPNLQMLDRPPAEVPPAEAGAKTPSANNLKELFAKIFSQPILQDLMQAQVTREAGELADVLDLTDEQIEAVQREMERRKRSLPPGMPGSSSGPEPGTTEADPPLEEALRSILTPGQHQKYQEYTEKKNALAGSPALEREVFELNWRLKLTQEQEDLVREILREQGEKMAQTAAVPTTSEGNASPAERLETHLERRKALNKETEEKMKAVLEEPQHEAFVRYQVERDTETRLLRRLIEEERGERAEPTP